MVLTDNPVSSWPFLQEPAWRWFIFVGALLLILALWGRILGYMRG